MSPVKTIAKKPTKKPIKKPTKEPTKEPTTRRRRGTDLVGANRSELSKKNLRFFSGTTEQFQVQLSASVILLLNSFVLPC